MQFKVNSVCFFDLACDGNQRRNSKLIVTSFHFGNSENNRIHSQHFWWYVRSDLLCKYVPEEPSTLLVDNDDLGGKCNTNHVKKHCIEE